MTLMKKLEEFQKAGKEDTPECGRCVKLTTEEMDIVNRA